MAAIPADEATFLRAILGFFEESLGGHPALDVGAVCRIGYKNATIRSTVASWFILRISWIFWGGRGDDEQTEFLSETRSVGYAGSGSTHAATSFRALLTTVLTGYAVSQSSGQGRRRCWAASGLT